MLPVLSVWQGVVIQLFIQVDKFQLYAENSFFQGGAFPDFFSKFCPKFGTTCIKGCPRIWGYF